MARRASKQRIPVPVADARSIIKFSCWGFFADNQLQLTKSYFFELSNSCIPAGSVLLKTGRVQITKPGVGTEFNKK